MTLMQKRVHVSNDMRVDLYLISDGTVVLVPTHGFTKLVEYGNEVNGTFDEHGFSLTDAYETVSYEWHTPYPFQQRPVLKAWLIQQKLVWTND